MTNTQYDEIARTLEARKMAAERLASAAKDAVYEKYPRLSAIDAEIADASLKKARIRLGLSSDADFDLDAVIEKLAQEKKRIFAAAGYPEGDVIPEYTCPICQDTGFVDGQKCICFKKEEALIAFAGSNLASLPEDETFETFSLEWYSDEDINENSGISAKEYARKALEYSKNFAEHFGETFDNIVFTGAAGVGKTFLSNCIARALLDKGVEVLYLTAFELFRILEADAFRPDEESGQMRDLIFNCELLIIDDLGANSHNSFIDAQLFGLLNERMLAKKPVIISTNLSMEQLRDTYTDRIYSRLISSYKRLYLFGKDIRIQKKLFGGDQR